MCVNCGVDLCNCQTVTMPPCVDCGQDNGCNPKVPAKCVTINNTNVEQFFECNNFLNYVYNCLILDPVRYAQWCELWANCAINPPCNPITGLTVVGSPTTTSSVIVTWNTEAGTTYDIYLDNILIQAGTTSPYTLTGLTFATVHTVKIVSHCANGGSNIATAQFSLCNPATTFAVNSGLSTPNSALVQWTAAAFTAYDLYKDNVLVQVGATSPYVFNGLTPNTAYVFKIVSRCPTSSVSTIYTFYEVNYTTSP